MYGSVRSGLKRRLLFFSHSVVSNSLRPHGLQHARIPCPLPSSRAEHRRIECFQTMVLEKTLESPLDSKEIKPVNPKGNQPWIFIGRTDVEVDAPILCWLIGKAPDAGKDWGQEEKEMTEDEIGITDSMDMSLSKLWEIVKDRKGWCCSPRGHT